MATIRRPSVVPLDEWIDDFMLGLGLGTLDLAQEPTRAKVRQYVHGQMRRWLTLVSHEAASGAERGVRQTIDFMVEPGRAERLKKARSVRSEQRKTKAVAQLIDRHNNKSRTDKIQ